MIKVYALALAIGFVGLLVMIMGGALAENLGRVDKDPGERFGLFGKMMVGVTVGFGMGGISAEYSPLDLAWPVSLLIAIAAAGIVALWVGISAGRSSGR